MYIKQIHSSECTDGLDDKQLTWTMRITGSSSKRGGEDQLNSL